MNLATEARQFLRSTQHGVLSTQSSKHPGYPFGSVTPFVLDHAGQPVILISTIAEHTKNILADARVSLLVFAGGEDLQANARLTLLGEMSAISKQDADLRARYLRYLPQAASYFDMHDFDFYRLHIRQARYIAGFGKMGWMAGEALHEAELATEPSSKLAAQEQGIVEHMNDDHVDSMLAYLRHYHGLEAQHAQMLGLDRDGFDLKATLPDGAQRQLRFAFEQPVSDAMSARTALVAMSKAARA